MLMDYVKPIVKLRQALSYSISQYFILRHFNKNAHEKRKINKQDDEVL